MLESQTPSVPLCSLPAQGWKLWLYTNYDCNLRCRYCVAQSSPQAQRRALGLETVQKAVDEAAALGFAELFLTGGEPFILDDIYEMISFATTRLPTTVLTNAMLFSPRRLQRLRSVRHDNLCIQVSLDGGRAGPHDAYRGPGTWEKTVAGLRLLLAEGLRVRISTTETPANSAHLEEIAAFRRSLGIADEDHLIRPLARRGFSQEGITIDLASLTPELTITREGVYWHPLASPSSDDLLVTRQIFPLADAVACIQTQLEASADGDRQTFT